jgi:hypothetical protein
VSVSGSAQVCADVVTLLGAGMRRSIAPRRTAAIGSNARKTKLRNPHAQPGSCPRGRDACMARRCTHRPCSILRGGRAG